MLFIELETKGKMQIHAITSRLAATHGGKSGFGKAAQALKDVGSALESGDLSAAKDAFAELQQFTPRSFGKARNPMSLRMEALSNALDAGDLKAAQDAYSDIKLQRSAGKGHSVTPPAEPPPVVVEQPTNTNSTPGPEVVYDVMDANKDGTVSDEERSAYAATQSQAAGQNSTPGTIDSDRGTIDALA